MPDDHETRIKRNEKDIQEIWNKLDELMRRFIPVWVASIISLMAFITGCSLTFAGMIIRSAIKG